MSIRSVLISVTCGAGLASSAFAIDITSTFSTVNPGVDAQITYGYTDSFNPGTTENTRAGQMNWVRQSGGFPNLSGNSYSAFCIEVTQNITYGGTYSYDINALPTAPRPAGLGAPMGQAKADLIAELYGRHFSSLTTNSDYAAFQSSIWNIVYDNDTSISSGAFFVNSFASDDAGIRSQADNWLSGLNGDANFFQQGLFALTSDSVQDMIVPSPGSVALLGMGSMFVLRRRR